MINLDAKILISYGEISTVHRAIKNVKIPIEFMDIARDWKEAEKMARAALDKLEKATDAVLASMK